MKIAAEPLSDHPHLAELCAGWNYEQWGEEAGFTLKESLEGFARPGAKETAVVGLIDGNPAGAGLLVECDLASHAHLRPWIAGIHTLPHVRRLGLGRAMMRALEEIAQARGERALYLYTHIPDFYRRIGWHELEQFSRDGEQLTMMAKELRDAAQPGRSPRMT